MRTAPRLGSWVLASTSFSIYHSYIMLERIRNQLHDFPCLSRYIEYLPGYGFGSILKKKHTVLGMIQTEMFILLCECFSFVQICHYIMYAYRRDEHTISKWQADTHLSVARLRFWMWFKLLFGHRIKTNGTLLKSHAFECLNLKMNFNLANEWISNFIACCGADISFDRFQCCVLFSWCF